MTSVLPITFFVVCVACGTVFSLPCLTNKSKQDFNKARNALKSLENFLKNQASSINSKVQALDKDMTSMEEDFKRRQWIKYNKHCYYIGDDSVRWTDAERKCREIGGYLVKIDDSSENSWIKQQISKSSKKTYYWMGSTDVVNGDWRWIYDQTQLSYKNFYSGRPFPTSNSNSYTFNCIMMHYGNGLWYDYQCNYVTPYVCESNFCFQ
ncbi:perlucin-like protein [Mytilus californianus]|uniref:perlucin-like protein n=1 Tax=Mytilus californianus TaxID=6549 RepID=UPI0022455510|nr:perlucin-like protein [Mytilus californianus]